MQLLSYPPHRTMTVLVPNSSSIPPLVEKCDIEYDVTYVGRMSWHEKWKQQDSTAGSDVIGTLLRRRLSTQRWYGGVGVSLTPLFWLRYRCDTPSLCVLDRSERGAQAKVVGLPFLVYPLNNTTRFRIGATGCCVFDCARDQPRQILSTLPFLRSVCVLWTNPNRIAERYLPCARLLYHNGGGCFLRDP